MENKNMRKLNVTVQCMAVYNSSIMVPRELTFEEAIKYAKEHIDEINLGELEYISDSDELDEENCDFDEEEDTDSDCRVLYETGIEEPEIFGSGSTYSNVVYFPDEERAFEEFHHCGRNYLHRITYRKKSPYTTTEWWDEDLNENAVVLEDIAWAERYGKNFDWKIFAIERDTLAQVTAPPLFNTLR